jgi:DNA/RNA-binding domain of Phe-tRNA-synthetase-like protein
MLKKSLNAYTGGTSLQGYIYTDYEKLVETFGEPSHDGDGYKTDAEWVLADDTGHVVTIYNWKDGPNYLGEEDGTPVEWIYEWHIGGRDDNAVDLVQDTIPTANTRKGW